MSRRAVLCVIVLAAVAFGIQLAPATAAGPPPPTILTTPPNPSGSSNATFTFLDADPMATFLCQMDGDAFTACQSGVQYTLADGSHTFGVKAVDSTMAESDVVSYTWVIDTTPPPAPSITATPSSSDDTPTFKFTDSEDGVNFRCKLDGHAFAGCSSPKTYAHQADGAHVFTVRAIDEVGNASSSSYAWTIDTIAPVLALTQAPPNPSASSNAVFAFSATDVSSVTFSCQLDGGAPSACTSPATYSALAKGAHVFTVRATDAAGNTSPAASYGWTVEDLLAPADVSGVRRTVGYGTVTLAWTRPPDPDFDHVQVFVSIGRKGPRAQRKKLVYTGNSTHYASRRFDNGTYHRYSIISYDRAGNASSGAPVVVQPSTLLFRPKAGGVVHVPPRLVWAKVRRASFYNVQLYRGGEKILSAWPSAPRLGLQRRWFYKGRALRLRTGIYSWYVWPAFGPRSKSQYGHLLGQSTFTVA